MISTLTFVLMFVEIVSALLLIFAIMIQKSTSSGGGLAIGTNVGEAYWGAKAGNVLTRMTVILGIVFLVNTTLLGFLGKLRGTTGTSIGESLSGRRSGVPAATPAGPSTRMSGQDEIVPVDVDDLVLPAGETGSVTLPDAGVPVSGVDALPAEAAPGAMPEVVVPALPAGENGVPES